MILVIAPLIVIFTILFGGLIAWVTAGVDTAVKKNYEEIENKDKGYNQRMTFGYRVKVEASPEEQIKEARKEMARQAAATPRGANMRIGSKGTSNLKTAGTKEALEHDAWSAAKIAQHHGWDGVQTGAVVVAAVPGAVAAAPGAVAAPAGKIKLTPGKDYEYIEITDSMSPDEKRKARIANSKAKSAAMKAAKAAQAAGGVVPTAAPVAAAAAPAAQPVAAAPAAVDIEAPVLVELTDDMAPDEKRKARIANSKAKSAFNKALKAAGIDPKSVEIVDGKVVMPAGATPVAAVPAAQPVAAAPVAAAPAAVPAPVVTDIPKPDLIEITDDMPPDEKRKARIANSKAKSAYNKALKAAGIDPKSVA